MRCWVPWLACGLALGCASGCGNPCRELSRKICDCKPSLAQRQACQSRVNARAAVASEADSDAQAACAARLEGCDCAALAAGAWQRCGLSTEDLAGS